MRFIIKCIYTFWLIWFINQGALYNHVLSIVRRSPRYLTQHNGTLRRVRDPPIRKNGALLRHFGVAKITHWESKVTTKSVCI